MRCPGRLGRKVTCAWKNQEPSSHSKMIPKVDVLNEKKKKNNLRNRYSKKRKWNGRLFTVLGRLLMEPVGLRGRYRHHPFLPVCMQTLLMDHSTFPGSEAPPASQSWYHK